MIAFFCDHARGGSQANTARMRLRNPLLRDFQSRCPPNLGGQVASLKFKLDQHRKPPMLETLTFSLLCCVNAKTHTSDLQPRLHLFRREHDDDGREMARRNWF